MADEAKTAKKTTAARAAGLTNAFAALAAVPAADETAAPAAPRARQARTRKAAAPAAARPAKPARAVPMAAEQARPPAWDARFSLTLSREMKRDLDQARVEDGIEGTARIRAMITLWQEDEKLRARVDKLARTLK